MEIGGRDPTADSDLFSSPCGEQVIFLVKFRFAGQWVAATTARVSISSAVRSRQVASRLKEYPVYLSFLFLIGQVMHMKRVRKNRTQGRLCVERLEARRYLAADVGNSLLDSGVEYIPNELLVQYATQSMAVKRGPAFVGIDAEVSETIHTKAMQSSGLGVLERVTLGSGISMQSAMEAIKRNPNVLYVEPNYIYRPAVISNDTYYTNGSLWGMYSNDSPSGVGPSGTTN
jgi:hypothetical protein